MSIGPGYCEHCDYEAGDGYFLNMHTYAEHEQDIDSIDNEDEHFQNVDENNSLKCQFCGEHFNAKKDLMLHKKLKHKEQNHKQLVPSCNNFK